MPRTRNVARLQENASSASYSTRPRNNNENKNGPDSEKENDGRRSLRASRAQHRSHTTSAILGATTITTLGMRTNAKNSTTTTTLEPKKKKKGKAPQREKLPLQDITSQFLPAPEAANRGEGYTLDDEEQVVADDLAQTTPLDPVAPIEPVAQAYPPSPLPPSSPPSDLSPFKNGGLPAGTRLQFGDIISPTSQGAQVNLHDAWDETYEFAPAADRSSSDSSKSDPFGFVALERKLKTEREAQDAAARSDGPEHHEHSDADDIPFADTSSPRPVRRLKRSFSDEELIEEGEERQVDCEDELASPPRLAAPPTPHKDKKKRPRLSHEGHNIFSPCTSSIESSPSPTKVSARKSAGTSNIQDPLDEFNAEVDRTLDEIPTSVLRTRKQPPRGKKQEDEAAEEDDLLALLPKRRTRMEPEEQSSGSEDDKAGEKPKKPRRTKAMPQRKARSHSRPVSSKKEKSITAEEVDLPEKWEQERLERIEYFKRLEGYDLEKEDVHVI